MFNRIIIVFIISLFCVIANLYCNKENQLIIEVNKTENLYLLENIIKDKGGRVAVKVENYWLIRLPDNTNIDANEFVAIKNIWKQNDKTNSTTVSQNNLFNNLINWEPDFDTSHSFKDGPYLINEIETNQLKDNDEIQNYPPTSWVMTGSSVVNIFFVNNTNYASTNSPTWTNQKQSVSLANIVYNLVWWSDQAYYYGIEKTFEIIPYYYTNPITHIDFDPTVLSAQSFANDRFFQEVIMDNLGYKDSTDKMRRFAHNSRVEHNTDWAFLAFILEGKEDFRARAMHNGPYTVLPNNSTQTGYTFAHEVGHIYGATDEYWEASRANQLHNFNRFNTPNGNFNWRSYPVIPSMMGLVHTSGISYYTAVHLGLAKEVLFTKIRTNPPNAPYIVEYLDNFGNITSTSVFKGDVDFHWGAGMKIRLQAYEKTAYNGYYFISPQWDQSSSSSLTIEIKDNNSQTINLDYYQTMDKAEYEWYYLTVGNALPSVSIRTMSINEEGEIGFGGDFGISVWDGKEKHTLDYGYDTGREGFFRACRTSEFTNDGSFYFAAQHGEILKWNNKTITSFIGPNTDLNYTYMAALDNNSIITSFGYNQFEENVISTHGIHYFDGNDIQMLNTTNSNIPSDYVFNLSRKSESEFWIAFDKNETSNIDKGLYQFEPAMQNYVQFDGLSFDKYLSNITNKDNKNTMVINDIGIYLINDKGILDLGIELDPLDRNFNVFQAVCRNNIIALATSEGLWIYKDFGDFIKFNIGNSEIIDNYCTVVDIRPKGEIVVNTRPFVSVLKINNLSVYVLDNPDLYSNFFLFDLHPNPTNDKSTINYYTHNSGNIIIDIVDLNGKKIIELYNGFKVKGFHNYEFFINEYNLSSGIYFIILKNEHESKTKKLIIR